MNREDEPKRLVVPFRRTSSYLMVWWIAFACVGLVEASRHTISLVGFAVGEVLGWWRVPHGTRPDYPNLPCLPPDSRVQTRLKTGVRTLVIASSLLPFVVIGIFPPMAPVGAVGGGVALGISVRWFAGLKRAMSIERKYRRRLYFEVIPLGPIRSRRTWEPAQPFWSRGQEDGTPVSGT